MRSALAAFILCTVAAPLSAQALVPGEQLTTDLLSARAPSSSGWQLSSKTPARIALARGGTQPNETFAAYVIVFRIEQPRDRDHFLELIRNGVAADTSPDRFRAVKVDFHHDESRGYPCVLYTAIHDDLQARLRSGATGTLATQTQTLYCLHPQERGTAFAAGYSHRGEALHAEFATEATQFIASAHVRTR